MKFIKYIFILSVFSPAIVFSAESVDLCPSSFVSAEIRLKQDLQVIRNSPQEPLLREQGFKPSYYAGVDQAREFNRVKEYLQDVQADPKRTHIPYFSDQVEKTISDFERGFRQQNKENAEFLEEGLKLLEDFKKEARKRIENQEVTYDWWSTFNLRLAGLGSKPESNFVQELISLANTQYFRKLEDAPIREKLGIEIEYNKQLAQAVKKVMDSYPERRRRLRFFQSLQKRFENLNPEELFSGETYTSKELQALLTRLASTNQNLSYRRHALEQSAKHLTYNYVDSLKTHEGMQTILSDISKARSSGTPIEGEISGIQVFVQIKEKFPEEVLFFTTDELGIMSFNKLNDGAYFVGLSGISLIVDEFRMHPVEYLAHDFVHIDAGKEAKIELNQNILERVDNISKKSDREKASLALFMYRHELGASLFSPELKQHFNNPEKNISKAKLEQLRSETQQSTRKLMRASVTISRFLEPNDLQMILPDSVNVNNREEVELFLDEAADIFTEILLAR